MSLAYVTYPWARSAPPTADRPARSRRLFVAALAAVWLLAVGSGLLALTRYENTPGVPGAPPASWPPDTTIARSPDGRATLVMLVHPRCPCSTASIEDLDRLMLEARGRVDAHVLFFKPTAFAAGWAQTDLWRRAAAIPGVVAHEDPDGADARRFGAFTSGQTVLYDAAGRLLFAGGLTASRGHAGDNDGAGAIVALLRGGATERRATPVFGCSLVDPATGGE